MPHRSNRAAMMLQHFALCFKVLSIGGICPGKLKKPFVALNYIVSGVILLLCFINTMLEFSADQMEQLFLILEVIIKEFTILVNFRAIEELISDTKQFWPVNLQHNKMLSRYLKIQKVYLAIIVTSMFEMWCKPFVSKGSTFGCYFPPEIPFVFTYIFEVYTSFVSVTIFAGTNVICCLLVVMVAEQFFVFNEKLRSLDLSQVKSSSDVEWCQNIFREFVIHHNFLLRFVQKLNGILSVPIFMSMGTCILALCFSMYNSVEQTDSLILKFRSIFISLCTLTEFFFIYGYPAQLMMDEAEKVTDSLYYYCEWYLPNVVSLKQYFLMMIMRSQVPPVITGEGFFPVNNTTVVLMARTTYSFFTFLRTIQQE